MVNAKSKEPRRLVIATRNAGKAKEFNELLGADWEIKTLLDLPKIPDVVEDGDTFEANSQKKAVEISLVCDDYVLADDSGLEVDALNGAPGVYSARYAGEPKDDAKNLAKLIDALKNIPDEKRGAQFRCVLSVARKGQVLVTVDGVCRGRILHEAKGNGGFGYDPVFAPDGFSQTFAEISSAEKHALSHRGKAMRKLSEYLLKFT